MKNKYFLGVIPALLVLSACNGGAQKEQANYKNDFLEDTLAHEEIFGSVEEGLAPRRLSGPNFSTLSFEDPVLDPELNPDVTNEHPTIGVQTFYNEAENKVSFRFVAAVHFDDADAREATNAVWTRSVSKADCSAYPLDADVTPAPECTTAYKKLSNDGGAYTIEKYNSDHGGTGYTHFVVYTLRNIDLSKYAGSDYYVSAYLSLSGAVGDVSSKAIAIRFDRNKKYSYAHDVGTGFIEGTFSGTPTVIEKTAVENDSNAASFKNRTIAKGDTFIIKAFDGTKLKIRNASNFTGDGNNSGYYFSAEDGKMKATYTGSFDLYLNSSHQIYTTALSLTRKIYVSLADGSVNWWEGTGIFTALYAYVDGGAAHWYELESLGDHLYVTKQEINTATYNRAIVGRIDTSVENDDSTGWWDSGKVYNQTKGGSDSSALISLSHDHAYVKRNSNYEPLYIDWWD